MMTRKYKRRNKAEWIEIVRNCEQSPLSLRAFAESNEVNYHTLQYWREKLARKASVNKPAFVQVVTKETQRSPIANPCGMRLITSDGTIIESPAAFGVQEIALLIQKLRSQK